MDGQLLINQLINNELLCILLLSIHPIIYCPSNYLAIDTSKHKQVYLDFMATFP